MSKKSGIRFTIDVQGRPRTVFQITENWNGDLTLSTTSGGKHLNFTIFGKYDSEKFESEFQNGDMNISVHRSKESKLYNGITCKIQDHGRQITKSVHLTSALKIHDNFAVLFFKVAGDLTRPRYEVPAGDRFIHVSLGEYAPHKDQLRFMVVLSNAGTEFPQDIEHVTNTAFFELRQFRITVLWSYLNHPSVPQANDAFVYTTRATGPAAGMEWWQVYNFYSDLNKRFTEAYWHANGQQVE